eukprot:NODE_1426_length_1144_cov_516.428834.p1 GENE.NODE_1426_length_1144_cov_516.428834~~NODE_1426_length_1144_cov_516.428834.p1  ORF type:complete len:222 (-),score=85.87 NODE_1426_length_1144_cov_516.428834:461-1033(-)
MSEVGRNGWSHQERQEGYWGAGGAALASRLCKRDSGARAFMRTCPGPRNQLHASPVCGLASLGMPPQKRRGVNSFCMLEPSSGRPTVGSQPLETRRCCRGRRRSLLSTSASALLHVPIASSMPKACCLALCHRQQEAMALPREPCPGDVALVARQNSTLALAQGLLSKTPAVECAIQCRLPPASANASVG